MNTPISPRDWELLSAYLDGQLKPADRAQVEARLWKDAALRNALDELDRTRAAVRQLPRLRAPRNYTLSPQKVKVRPALRLYPVFGMASALASVILVMIIVVDLLGQFAPGVIPVAQVTPPTATTSVEISPEAAPLAMGAPEATETETPMSKAIPEVSNQSTADEPAGDAARASFLLETETPTLTPTSSPTPGEGETMGVGETTVWVTTVPLGVATATPYGWQPTPVATETMYSLMAPTDTSTTTITPTETATPTVTPTDIPTDLPTETPTEAPPETIAPPATLQPSDTPTPTATDTPSPSRTPTATLGPIAATPLYPQALPDAENPTKNSGPTLLTLVEISLATLALLAGLVALLLRRRSRR